MALVIESSSMNYDESEDYLQEEYEEWKKGLQPSVCSKWGTAQRGTKTI